MYGNNQNFSYSPYDQRNPQNQGYVEQMDVSPQPPTTAYGAMPPQRPKMNEPMYFTPTSPGPMAPPTYGYPSYPPPQGGLYNPQEMIDPMMANFAMQYGSRIVGTGKEMVDQKIGKYVALSSLKYYFAVDTQYVLKKLSLLLFPFTNKEWHLKYQGEEPLPPRHDANAPDLYIPLMGYVTYVLLTGILMGLQDTFSPEMLGVISSQALAWIVLELLVLSITLYVTNIATKLKLLDMLAFIGYKFFTIIICIFLGLVFHKTGYYLGIIGGSISLVFFIMRSLRHYVTLYSQDFRESDEYVTPGYSTGTKRSMYFLFYAGVSQPVLIWCLSYHILGLLS